MPPRQQQRQHAQAQQGRAGQSVAVRAGQEALNAIPRAWEGLARFMDLARNGGCTVTSTAGRSEVCLTGGSISLPKDLLSIHNCRVVLSGEDHTLLNNLRVYVRSVYIDVHGRNGPPAQNLYTCDGYGI